MTSPRGGPAHAHECARIAALLTRRYPDHRIADEHQLRREERAHGAPLASATLGPGPGAAPRLHRPDLAIWPPGEAGGLPVAVEVELTLKAPQRLAGICRAWARCPIVAGVLYLAAPHVEPTLRRTVHALGAGERVTVVALDVLAGLLDDAPGTRALSV